MRWNRAPGEATEFAAAMDRIKRHEACWDATLGILVGALMLFGVIIRVDVLT